MAKDKDKDKEGDKKRSKFQKVLHPLIHEYSNLYPEPMELGRKYASRP